MSDDTKKYYLPTSIDLLNATLYATQKINKLICEDDLKTEYGEGKVAWKDNGNPLYRRPENLKDGTPSGVCEIISEDLCEQISTYPYPNCGTLPTIFCKTDEDCGILGYDAGCNIEADAKRGKCVPKHPYLEWRKINYDKDKTGEKKCMVSNFFKKQYAECPGSRRTEAMHGVTDVPPFKYNKETGKINMTQEYCKWMEVGWNSKKQDCEDKGIQKFLENYVIGRTIFRDLKYIIEGFQKNLVDISSKLADKKLIDTYTVLGKDFGGPGINLYQIIWKESAEKIDNSCVIPRAGFLADEVKKSFPEVVKKKNGYNFISVSLNQVKKNPKLKRIYFVNISGVWLLDNIIKTI
jgi:hypothetical protein